MNYEKLLKIHDNQITFQTLEKFDEYLASLDDAEGGFLYPELVSNILDIDLPIVEKLLVYSAELSICKTRYEITCPVEEVAFIHTFDPSDLNLPSLPCTKCDLHSHDPSACEVIISFKLLEIKNIKKKAYKVINATTPNTFDISSLKDLVPGCQVNIHINYNTYEGQVNQINQGEGSVTNTGTNQGTITNTNRSANQERVVDTATKKADESSLDKIISFFSDNKTLFTISSLGLVLLMLVVLYSLNIISQEQIKEWVGSYFKAS